MNLVLVHPQIPPNTGNIARTCAATETRLHLVGPLGFDVSDKAVKRAGLDYWPYVDIHHYESVDTFKRQIDKHARWVGFSKIGTIQYTDFEFQANDWLLFGSEIHGLPKEIREGCHAQVYIPMPGTHVRSLNLAAAAAVGLYEAYRQVNY
ncbi:MAG: tRNA (cytidine(34)-2'-O)-methyltransferase [Candidatus Magnetomorum sp.]|nr:tRNA (cytidine(34)-2'-O)-methyltransferase [Candidatus Magnetomorum sp.]